MNNSRNKKLLASFLTALGLTTNSANVNVSANFKQFGRDLRFACRILGGQKAEERNELDDWVGGFDDQLKSFIEDKKDRDKEQEIWYLYFYSVFLGLFNKLENLKIHRNGFNSELISSLNDVQGLKEFHESLSKHFDDARASQLSDKNGNIKLTSDSLKYKDVLEICKPIYENVHGGKLSAWTPRVNKTLKSLCENQEITDFMINFENTHTKQENNTQNNNSNMQNQNNFNQNNNSNMQNQNNFNQNNNFNMQNNNINQDLISNNNNPQGYHGPYWEQNSVLIGMKIMEDYNSGNGVFSKAVDPKGACDWLGKLMIPGVIKHAIKPIDEALNQNSDSHCELLALKKILQGNEKLVDFKFSWDNKYGLACRIYDSNCSFSFTFNKNHVDIYNDDGFYSNDIFKITGNFIADDCLMLSFDLPNKDNDKYNSPSPQKKQNMNMMGQNNFGGMQNNMNNFNMQNYPNYPNYPNYQSQPNNNGFNNNGFNNN